MPPSGDAEPRFVMSRASSGMPARRSSNGVTTIFARLVDGMAIPRRRRRLPRFFLRASQHDWRSACRTGRLLPRRALRFPSSRRSPSSDCVGAFAGRRCVTSCSTDTSYRSMLSILHTRYGSRVAHFARSMRCRVSVISVILVDAAVARSSPP